ncbi:MAG: hypothetical protein HY958_03210 [Bacteroidia bacterium]|nr:hypothetical protein [Bacteroidia bacterium]
MIISLIQKYLILILLLVLYLVSFSQEISNVNFYKKDNKIVVTYDLVNTLPHQAYDIKLRFKSDAGKTYIPRMISGDFRKVSRGKNKMIFWDFTKDEKELTGTLQPVLEISKIHYITEKDKSKKDYKSNSKSKNKWKSGQDMKGLFFGGETGAYFANKYTANYYNGTGTNSIYNILNPNNTYYQTLIRPVLNNYNYTYDSTSLPQNMKYDISFMVGFLARYHFSDRSALYFEMNTAKLKTTDVFMLKTDSVTSFTDPVYVECGIYGYESRFEFNLCYYQVFGKNKIFNPFFVFGANLNNTQVKKNEIKIKTLTYSIMNPQNAMYHIQQGGIGYGLILGAGYQMNFNEKFTFDIGVDVGIKKINLGENQAFKPNPVFYIRIILKSFGLGVSVSKGSDNLDNPDQVQPK